jgi:uncharacterized membrane protein SirB2
LEDESQTQSGEWRRTVAHEVRVEADAMIDFYPHVKAVHVAMITASGAFFALRGIAALSGLRWPLSWPVRVLSYGIDTTLLAAALVLLAMLPWATFANGWLLMKVGLLVVYVVLGYLALRSGRSMGVRWALYALALLVYGWMYTIARNHHPLGVFHEFIEP